MANINNCRRIKMVQKARQPFFRQVFLAGAAFISIIEFHQFRPDLGNFAYLKAKPKAECSIGMVSMKRYKNKNIFSKRSIKSNLEILNH
jgi:hypothetical protein